MKSILLFAMTFLLFSAIGREIHPNKKGPGFSGDHPSLPIGSPAPAFSLPGTDGKTYSLASFGKADVLVIVFTCNHCPTAQAYEDRIIQLTKDYSSKNVAVVAIMPNDPASINLDELGYTDMGDSFEEMKVRAAQKKFNFPYLYDGENEKVSLAYGPVATPHVFIFDNKRILRYSGRIDDMEKPTMTAHDKTFKSGRIGIGTFDDTADFAEVKLWGNKAKPALNEGIDSPGISARTPPK